MINSLLATQTFSRLSQDPANRLCFECGAPAPVWASLPNAIFLCLTCAGLHRQLGVQISFVRSTTMDSWSEKQLKMMLVGGNQKLKDYFTSIGIYQNEYKEIGWKYRTKGAAYYRELIKSKVEELPLPEAPPEDQALLEDSSSILKSMPIQTQNVGVPASPFQQPQQQLNDPAPEQQQQSDDTIEKVKLFFVSGIQKTQELAKEAAQKIDEKYHDEEFQTKMKNFKENASKKTSEISVQKVQSIISKKPRQLQQRVMMQ